MSARMLDLLLRQYPGQVCLDVAQIAQVLNRQPDTIRDWIKAGRLPGARRVLGRWMIPLPDLAEVLEPEVSAPPLSVPPKLAARAGRRRRRAIVMN